MTTKCGIFSIILILATIDLSADKTRAAIIIPATGDTLIQDRNDGVFSDMFGFGGNPFNGGVITQKHPPFYVEVRNAIRFDLGPIVGLAVNSATLQLIQINGFRGLQSGTVDVFGFTDDATPELDDALGGTFLGQISAPGIAGAILQIDVTAFMASASALYGLGHDYAVFRLQNPIASGEPQSLEFLNSRISGGTDPLLIINSSAAIPEPGTWAAAALLIGGASFVRLRRRKA